MPNLTQPLIQPYKCNSGYTIDVTWRKAHENERSCPACLRETLLIKMITKQVRCDGLALLLRRVDATYGAKSSAAFRRIIASMNFANGLAIDARSA